MVRRVTTGLGFVAGEHDDDHLIHDTDSGKLFVDAPPVETAPGLA